jgi:hypothetical protein
MASVLDSRRLAVAFLAALATIAAGPASATAASGIKAAVAVDSDSDGSVDAVDVSFTASVKGKAQKRGPFAFAVAGYSVTGVAKPRGAKLRVHVAELPGCDSGLRPKVSYRPRGKAALTLAGGQRLPGAKIDMERRDRRPPALTCAVTADSDANGRLDAVVLTYSKRVRSPAQSGAKLPFQVDRYTLRGVDRARGRNITLRLRERAAADTGAVPAVIYKPPKKRRQAVAGSRGLARSATFNATRDRARPLLLSSRTRDDDADGSLDGLSGRWSEPVRAGSSGVDVSGSGVTSVRVDGAAVTATLAGDGFGTAARPSTTWGARGSVRDLNANPAVTATRAPDDGAAPVLVAARTADRGGAAGRIDAIELTFSESVSHAADSDGSYPFGVTGHTIAVAGGASGARIDLALHEGGVQDGGARPFVGYARGTGSPVLDSAGNEAATNSFAGTGDGVVPRLVGATTGDDDSDGRIDAVAFQFSEPVQSAAAGCPGCGFGADGLTAVAAGGATGATVRLAVAEGGYNGGLRPLASYGPVGGGAVADSAGNSAPAATVTAADGTPPVVLAAETADADDDARIDAVELTFSESLSYAGDTQAPFSLQAGDGYSVAEIDGAVGSSLTVHLQERAGPDTGSAPDVSYDGAGGAALRDLNGVQHAIRSYPGLTRDAVAPRFVGGRTADRDALDGDLPGRIDAVDLVYSEQVSGTADPGDFGVGVGRSIESIAFGPDSVQIRIGESAGPDTDTTLPVSYTPGDVADIPEGPGDTADPAPAADVEADDGAGPAIVAGETVDADVDGIVDRVDVELSEPAAYGPGAEPALGLSDGLEVTGVAVDGPTGLQLAVAPADDGNGGLTPSVTVAEPARLTDLTSPANPARDGASAAVTDGVRPILVGARSGETDDDACGGGSPGNDVDCVRAQWSEAVGQPASASAFALPGFTLLGLLPGIGGDSTDLAIAAAPRDQTSDLTYTAGGPGAVEDLGGNPALSATVEISAACEDTAGTEPNDVRDAANPLLTSTSSQTLCAGDDDWFRVVATSDGSVAVLVNPVEGLDTQLTLVNGGGTVVATSSNPPGTGLSDIVQFQNAGLPGATYWIHLHGAQPSDEGDYCIDASYVPGTGCEDGDTNPT